MNETSKGIISTVSAFVIWGTVPVYWKLLDHVPPSNVMAHRVVWSFIFVLTVILIKGRVNEVKAALSSPGTFITMVITSILIGTNWLIFIWAVNTEQIVEASLGYFINPLINVLLGVVFLRERLRIWQTIPVILAAIGVVLLTVQSDRFPWIALVLAFSFGLYGLLRKTAKVASLPGLTVELLILIPFATFYIFKLNNGQFFGETDLAVNALLIGGGVVTAVPLLLFAHGARRIPYATVGFFQYIAPTGQLLIGVLLYGEPFTLSHLVSFGFIWVALLLYSFATFLYYNKSGLKHV